MRRASTATPAASLPEDEIRDFIPTGSDVAWASVRYDIGTEHRWALLRTADGGGTWAEVTPSQVQTHFGRVFALDADHAWVFDRDPAHPHPSTGETELWATVDGGARWQRSGTVPSARCQLSFVDSTHGWCGVGDTTMNSGPFAVLSTSDGGASWSLVSRTKGLVDGGPPPTPHAVPVACAKIGPVFETQERGWIGSYCLSAPPWLFGTVDGGRSWYEVIAPVPHDLPPEWGASVEPPVFDGRRGVFVIEGGNPRGPVVVIETTADLGRTWTPTVFKTTRNRWEVAVADAQHWRMTDGEVLLSTDDGGETWSRIHPDVPLVTQGWAGAAVGELRFATPAVGWIVVPSGPSRFLGLGRTTDGGATWKPVGVPGLGTSWPPAPRAAPLLRISPARR
jgi:photosystem II stability/assembly factor-like uncharacterized protein